ncbi:hypothetical protein BDZ89DRAFT_1046769 [Hymenopellis radicata]|nr:hypothetical protein BDZ89DRAFT_1046769 [Hymenopellis radicata]
MYGPYGTAYGLRYPYREESWNTVNAENVWSLSLEDVANDVHVPIGAWPRGPACRWTTTFPLRLDRRTTRYCLDNIKIDALAVVAWSLIQGTSCMLGFLGLNAQMSVLLDQGRAASLLAYQGTQNKSHSLHEDASSSVRRKEKRGKKEKSKLPKNWSMIEPLQQNSNDSELRECYWDTISSRPWGLRGDSQTSLNLTSTSIGSNAVPRWPFRQRERGPGHRIEAPEHAQPPRHKMSTVDGRKRRYRHTQTWGSEAPFQ